MCGIVGLFLKDASLERKLGELLSSFDFGTMTDTLRAVGFFSESSQPVTADAMLVGGQR